MTYHLQPPTQSRGGGRAASPALRQSLQYAAGFTGLEETVDRYDLLLLAKRAGKAAGFTPRLLQLLDYYMSYTRDCDWEEGGRPIVYQSLARTALDLGVSERQIQLLEKQLFEVGAITWNDSGNHKRYGQRDPQTGHLLYAFGVDLTPLSYLRGELKSKLHDKELYEEAWLQCKREISAARRQICALFLEWEADEGNSAEFLVLKQRYEAIAVQIRTHINLPALRELLQHHQGLQASLLARVLAAKPAAIEILDAEHLQPLPKKPAPRSEVSFAHYKYKTLEINKDCSLTDSSFQKSVAEPSQLNDLLSSAGVQHVTLKAALRAASHRFRERLPTEQRPLNWNDLTEAAYSLRSELDISQASWSEACTVLGRIGATICLLITDQAVIREYDPVLKPPAYFNAMIARARAGELRLHSSIFGLIEASQLKEH